MKALLYTNDEGDFTRRVTRNLAVERLARAIHRQKYSDPSDPMYVWDDLSPEYQTRLVREASELIIAIFNPIPPDEEPPPVTDKLRETLA